MRALARSTWGEGVPDCSRCAHDPAVARELGCMAEPATRSLYTATCSTHGRACPKTDAMLPHCKDGQRHFYRCPRKLTEGRADLHAALRAFVHYSEFGALPFSGGLLEQTSCLVDAFDVLRSEKVAIHNERVEKEELERHRKEMASRVGKVSRARRR